MFTSVDEVSVCDHSNESYLVILSRDTSLLHKVALTLKSVDESLVCNYSDESYYAVQGVPSFKSVYETLVCERSDESSGSVLKRKLHNRGVTMAK